jgi:hypothetical protein
VLFQRRQAVPLRFHVFLGGNAVSFFVWRSTRRFNMTLDVLVNCARCEREGGRENEERDGETKEPSRLA